MLGSSTGYTLSWQAIRTGPSQCLDCFVQPWPLNIAACYELISYTPCHRVHGTAYSEWQWGASAQPLVPAEGSHFPQSISVAVEIQLKACLRCSRRSALASVQHHLTHCTIMKGNIPNCAAAAGNAVISPKLKQRSSTDTVCLPQGELVMEGETNHLHWCSPMYCKTSCCTGRQTKSQLIAGGMPLPGEEWISVHAYRKHVKTDDHGSWLIVIHKETGGNASLWKPKQMLPLAIVA